MHDWSRFWREWDSDLQHVKDQARVRIPEEMATKVFLAFTRDLATLHVALEVHDIGKNEVLNIVANPVRSCNFGEKDSSKGSTTTM